MSSVFAFVSRTRYVSGSHRKLLATSILTGLAITVAPTLYATTYTVTNINDSGSGSLRDAIGQANSDALLPTVIVIPSTVTGTITLTTGEVYITHAMTVQGPGPTKLTVSGAAGIGATRLVKVKQVVLAETDVTISGLRFANGFSNYGGGAIASYGANLTLSNCIVENNAAAQGGGIFARAANSNGRIVLSGVTVRGNTARFGAGGIYVNARYGSALMESSVVSGNTALFSPYTGTQFDGGGAYLVGGSITVTSTRVSGNRAEGRSGGGIFAAHSAFSISDSEVSGNMAHDYGGGLHVGYSSMTMQRTLVDGNSARQDGGGLQLRNNYYSGSNGVTIQNSTISNNSANIGGGHGGGGINAVYDPNAAVTLTNVTIYGNTSHGLTGGGIRSEVGRIPGGTTGTGVLSIESSTITSNSADTAGGVAAVAFGGSNVSLYDSIVANNIAATANPDMQGAFNANYDFVKDATGATLIGAHNTIGMDPALGSLTGNGGPTPTMLPGPGSPVIDAGDPAFAPPPCTDQRGRRRVSGARIDIGAVETSDVVFSDGFESC